MNVFISYNQQNDRAVAENIYYCLISAGYKVFFDENSIPPGKDFNNRIRKEIQASDLFIFLISPESIAKRAYTRTELKIARESWPSPDGHILPVIVRPTDFTDIPRYLKAVNLLKPEGNIAAEVCAAVHDMWPLGSKLSRKWVLGPLTVASALLLLAVVYLLYINFDTSLGIEASGNIDSSRTQTTTDLPSFVGGSDTDSSPKSIGNMDNQGIGEDLTFQASIDSIFSEQSEFPASNRSQGSGNESNQYVYPEKFGVIEFGVMRSSASEYHVNRVNDMKIIFDNGPCKYAALSTVPDSVRFTVIEEGEYEEDNISDHAIIARIDVYSPRILTSKGVGIGTHEQQIFERYRNQIEIYFDPRNGERFLVHKPDPPTGFAIYFTMDHEKRVRSYRAGRSPEVDYWEGCA